MIPRLRTNSGFSLVELLLTVAIFGTITAMAVPVLKDVTGSIKLGEAARMVERELQAARLKSVSSNRELRVRMNCPATGYLRTVEVLGSAADTASGRCLESAYPFPVHDTDLMTRPNFDGPVRMLPTGATVSTSVIQFGPDGTATNVVSGVAQTIATSVTITITRDGKSRTVTVNGVGKVSLQ
jgi:prepilin-type N-terminal cleavage/methylation domain-containing protein